MADGLSPGTPVAVWPPTPDLKAFGHGDLSARGQHGSLTSSDPPCRLEVEVVGVTAEAP